MNKRIHFTLELTDDHLILSDDGGRVYFSLLLAVTRGDPAALEARAKLIAASVLRALEPPEAS